MPDCNRGAWWLVNQIAGTVPELSSKQRLVELRRRDRERNAIPPDDRRLLVPALKLEAQVEAERNRIARIEDKARGTVVGITIAVSVAGAGIGMFSRNGIFNVGGVLTYSAAFVLVLGLGYFLGSGWLALSAYAATPLHTPDLRDRPETRAANPSASGQSAATPDDDTTWRNTLLDCLDLNRFLATKKTNLFSASITLLRNGLLSIFLFAVLAIGGAIMR